MEENKEYTGLEKLWMDEVQRHADDQEAYQTFWENYYEAEKDAYAKILAEKKEVIEGTIDDIAQTLGLTEEYAIGFVDGISESVKGEKLDLSSMEKDTVIKIDIDFEKLLFNMHKAEAAWLYGLPEWDNIFDAEKQKTIEVEYKHSKTVHVTKVGRNDPCPCGSGKKYKKCCGK